MNHANKLTKISKIIHDNIHGYIGLSNFALHVINTKIFQRLANLKQLGPCRYIYPNAIHTRYEHSIGTYYLTGELISTIANLDNQDQIDSYLKTIPELQHYYKKHNITSNLLTPYVRELVKIAGLCHDIGHGPFSHLFDDVFLSKVFSFHVNISHEQRSNKLVEMIIKNNQQLNEIVSTQDIEFINSIISPNKSQTGFIYQIVSNNVNGLDVDKFDYLERDIKTVNYSAKIETTMLIKYIKVIDNNIVYPIQSLSEIENLFRTRHKMYRDVYLHHYVTSVEHLITEIMIELNNIMDLSNSVFDMNHFITLNDNTITECPHIISKLHVKLTPEQQQSHEKILLLLEKLNTLNFCSFISKFTTREKINSETLENIKQVVLNKFNLNIFCVSHKIGFLSGSKPNPFETIYFFDPDDSDNIKFTLNDKKISLPVLSSTKSHQEIVNKFYCTKNINFLQLVEIQQEISKFIVQNS